MAVTIVLPNALRPYAAGRDRVDVDASNVGEALLKLAERYPDLRGRMPADPDQLPSGSGIYLGGSDIRRMQGLQTTLRNDDHLTLIVPAGDL